MIRFFTDPHIGLNRTSHTTPASRAELKQALVNTVFDAIEATSKPVICLGDLFDTFDTDNNSMLDGFNVFDLCHLTLFGNHDLSNRRDLLSSIEVADYLSKKGGVVRHNISEAKASHTIIGDLLMWYVDHKLSQTIFDEALQDAYDQAELGNILLLHCNYDSPFATQESTLNLTRDRAEYLLTKFSHILIGHEHMSRDDFDGRVLLLGNTHPTGFSDISDKFVWDLKLDKQGIRSFEKELIWSVDKGYLAIDWTELSELGAIGDEVQFIEVKGTADQQHMPWIAAQVAQLWNLSEGLLMVRNNVTVIGNTALIEANEQTRCQSVPERITHELAGTKLEALWASYLEAI